MFWKWVKSHLAFELSFKSWDFAHRVYSLFLFSACDTWFPAQLFPPFVHKYFLLTIRHSEKGMSLNCQLVLCSDKRYHSSVSRLYVRNLESNTTCWLLEISSFDKWHLSLTLKVQSLNIEKQNPTFQNV